MPFFSESGLPERRLFEGVSLKSACGDKLMITIFDIEPGSKIPAHRHMHEQISYVLSGEIEFTLGEEKKILKQWDGVVIPPDVEHSGVILDKKTKILDAWHPVREDYK